MDKKSLRLKLFSLLCQFESIKTDKGELVVDKTLEEGVEAYIGENPAEDGDYVLEDGRTVVVKDGKVAEIKEKEVEEEKKDEVEEVKEEVEAEETVKEDEVVEETEVKEETTEDEVDVEALKKENEELKAKIVELEEKIKELNEKPVDAPIDQTVDGGGNSLFSDDKVKRNPALRYFQD